MEFRKNYTKVERVSAPVEGKTKTKGSFKEECDINNIMKRFEKTGILPEMIKAKPQYGDFSNPLDFQDAMNLVVHANEQFAALPARVRDRFGNDAARFLEFAQDGSNRDEMKKLGLLSPEALERDAGALAAKIEGPKPSEGNSEGPVSGKKGKNQEKD